MNIRPEDHADYDNYQVAIQHLTVDEQVRHIQSQAERLHGYLNGLDVQQDDDRGHLQLLHQLRTYGPNTWQGGNENALTRLHAAALYTAERQAAPVLHVEGSGSDTDHTHDPGSDSGSDFAHSSGSEEGGSQIHPL